MNDKGFGDLVGYRAPTAPGSPAFLDWLRGCGVGEPVVRLFAVSSLTATRQDECSPRFFSEGTIRGVADDFQFMTRDGLLPVGCCDNGDWIAIDFRRRPGQVGYISHETMHDAPDLYAEFWPVADSFVAFAELGARQPNDHPDARERFPRGAT